MAFKQLYHGMYIIIQYLTIHTHLLACIPSKQYKTINPICSFVDSSWYM